MSESAITVPICRICSLPKVRGRLWGWRCTLCDTRPVRHSSRYSTECLTCGVRYKSDDVKEINKFQGEHDRDEHDGASAWRNITHNDNLFTPKEER